MKTKTAAATAAVAVLAVGIGIAAPASAGNTDKRECVSKKEYREVREGMSVEKVQRIFDQRGVELFRSNGWMDKEYFTCTDGSATITFQHSGKRQTFVMRYKYADFF